jgi:hypothetical protein
MPAEQVEWVALQIARGCTYATIERHIGMPPGTLGQIVHYCRAGRVAWAEPIVRAVDARGGQGSSATPCEDSMSVEDAVRQRQAERIARKKIHPARRKAGAGREIPYPWAWRPEQIASASEVLRAGGSVAEAAASVGRSSAALSRAICKARAGAPSFAALVGAVEEGAAARRRDSERACLRVAERIKRGEAVSDAANAEGVRRSAIYSVANDVPEVLDALRSTVRARRVQAARRATPRLVSECMIYVIGAVSSSGNLEAFKVGHTTQRVSVRRKKLQCGNPLNLVILGEWRGEPSEEAALHERLTGYRLRGEWFKAVPAALEIAGVSWPKQS